VKPPTIRERALEDDPSTVKGPDKCEGIKHVFEDETVEGAICRYGLEIVDTPPFRITTKLLAGPLSVDPSTMGMMALVDAIEPLHVDPPSPLVTIRLRRVGPIITDSMNTVSIPAPAFLKDGERVLVAIYQTVGDWQPVEPRLP
jgi:hypothetical protein